MKVTFVPQNLEFDILPGESILDVAKRTDVFIKSVCGGVPSCTECRVRVVGGNHNVLPPGPKEKVLIGSSYFIDHSRLSCQLKCMGDIVVDLTDQIEKEKVLGASGKQLAYRAVTSANPDPDMEAKNKLPKK